MTMYFKGTTIHKRVVFLLLALSIVVHMHSFAKDAESSLESPQTSQSSPPQSATIHEPAPAPAPTLRAEVEKNDSPPKSAEFVDVARLVLEHNRDLATSTSAHIDRTINMLIFGTTVFAGLCAWLGWSKLKSLEDIAKNRLEEFNTELDALRKNAAQIRDGFSSSLDSAMDELRAEINCRIELLTARAEIANAENEQDINEKMQGFASAIARIERALELPNLPPQIKIKALADLGYSKKRNGDVEGALRKVIEAEAIARQAAPLMVPLLAYNAACYAVILGRADAQQWLTKAIAEDASIRETACADPDLMPVRNLPWFQALVAHK